MHDSQARARGCSQGRRVLLAEDNLIDQTVAKKMLVTLSHPNPTPAAQGRRVLLAEDNLINQTVAKKMLTSLGLRCEVAANGQEAVQRVAAGAPDGRQFDVVLMDMSMPVMGGVEATQARARARLRALRRCLPAGGHMFSGAEFKPEQQLRLARSVSPTRWKWARARQCAHQPASPGAHIRAARSVRSAAPRPPPADMRSPAPTPASSHVT
jgi:CheY-like chemotaxis protein